MRRFAEESEGIQRRERLGRPAGLPGERQCLRGDAARPSGADGAAELLREGVRLSGPAKGASHAALLEVYGGEPVGDVASGFGGRLIDDQGPGTGEELFGLAETARVHQRVDGDSVRSPLIPRFVGRRHRLAFQDRTQQLDGLVKATEPDQPVAHRRVRGRERS